MRICLPEAVDNSTVLGKTWINLGKAWGKPGENPGKGRGKDKKYQKWKISASLSLLCQKLGRRLNVQRLIKEEALPILTAHLAQPGCLRLGFHPFGHDIHPQIMRQR